MRSAQSCSQSHGAAPALGVVQEHFSARPLQALTYRAPIRARPASETSTSRCSLRDENSRAAPQSELRRSRNPKAVLPGPPLPTKRLLEPPPAERSCSRLAPETAAESSPDSATTRFGRC